MGSTEAPPNPTPPTRCIFDFASSRLGDRHRQRALLCARLRGRLALPHESRQLCVLQAVGLGLLPALLRLGEIGPGAGEAILDGLLARRAREPLRLGLGLALRARLLASRFGVGRARGGGRGGGSPRGWGSGGGRRRGPGGRRVLRVRGRQREAGDESGDEEAFHGRNLP